MQANTADEIESIDLAAYSTRESYYFIESGTCEQNMK